MLTLTNVNMHVHQIDNVICLGHIFAALSPFCLESAVQLSIIGIENLTFWLKFIWFTNTNRTNTRLPLQSSSALSTARFVCDVSRILHSGFRLLIAMISAITVVLPVPGGPVSKPNH